MSEGEHRDAPVFLAAGRGRSVACQIAPLETEILRALSPGRSMSVTGLVAEVGLDPDKFPDRVRVLTFASSLRRRGYLTFDIRDAEYALVPKGRALLADLDRPRLPL
jgi:hypothetical protein